MAKSTDGGQVRLQIPLHREVAEELERIARGFGRPVSWLARELLLDGVRAKESFGVWMAFKIVGAVSGNKRKKLQYKGLPDCIDGDVERIQVNVPKELHERIEKQARTQHRTTTNMAAVLLVWTLDDEGWLVEFVAKYADPLRALVGESKAPKRKSKKKVV